MEHSGTELTNLEMERSSEQLRQDSLDWDDPTNSANPLNWSKSQKNLHVILLSIFALYANLAATMFASSASQLVAEFHITNSIIAAMTVSIYVLGFAIGPLILAPLSECYGRQIVCLICNFVYIGFTAGCAFSIDVKMFLVFRFMCGCAASGPMSIGGGVVADLTPPEQRGKAMALIALGPLLGPVLGPVIGGFVAENIGWRWTFRIILIMSGVFGIISFGFLRETNARVIQRRKQEKGFGDKSNANFSDHERPREALLRAIVLPLKLLVFSPIVLLLSLYSGTLFGVVFLLFATIPELFQSQYHFDVGMTGLSYLGLGIGMIIGLVLFALLSDRLLGQKHGATVNRPEERLVLMKWFAPIAPVGCFIYGWSAYYKVHWIVPILGTFVIGLGGLFIFMPTQIYLVDAFGAEAAASALAANLLVRSPFGAFLTLAAPPLYDKLGLGWGNSIIGFIVLAFMPVPWLFYRYGEYLRTRFTIKL